MSFTLPELPYAKDALEPHIDARTMEIHHDKHHAGYTAKLNAAIEGTDLAGKSIGEILAGVSGHSTGVRNNGGGFYNHSLFWEVMSPNGEANLPEIWPTRSMRNSVHSMLLKKLFQVLQLLSLDQDGPGS